MKNIHGGSFGIRINMSRNITQKYYDGKIYEVEFMQYAGTDPIFESNLVKYMKYGNGFKSIKFVGNILK